MKTLIIIPSRLSATRLPGKPLLKINGKSIISHVFKKAEEANIGEVYVATEDNEIIEDIRQNGGQAILTHRNHKTGTDRICEALEILNKPNIELFMNLQGDEPLMNIEDIKNLQNKMIQTKSELGTLASIILKKDYYKNNDIVKVITNKTLDDTQFSEAIEFSREIPELTKNAYHHLGIYCYRIDTLKRFVSLSQSQNEIKNKLEQLRALENNININVALAKESSLGVDTEEDFLAIKKIMEYKLK